MKNIIKFNLTIGISIILVFALSACSNDALSEDVSNNVSGNYSGETVDSSNESSIEFQKNTADLQNEPVYEVSQKIIDDLKNDPTNSFPTLKTVFSDSFSISDFENYDLLYKFFDTLDEEVSEKIYQTIVNAEKYDVYYAISNQLYKKSISLYDEIQSLKTISGEYKDAQQEYVSNIKNLYVKDVPSAYEGSIGSIACGYNYYNTSKISVLSSYLFYSTYMNEYSIYSRNTSLNDE